MYVYGDQLVFIAHPRTASRSTTEALMRAGATMWDSHHGLDRAKTCKTYRREGIVASVHRNMFDVLVSWFHRANRSRLGTDYYPEREFTPWLETVLKGGHQYLDSQPYHFGYEMCNFRLPYDTLEETFVGLLSVCGMEPQPLGHTGISQRHRDYKVYYNEQTRRIVEDRWGLDLEMTGCEFEDHHET